MPKAQRSVRPARLRRSHSGGLAWALSIALWAWSRPAYAQPEPGFPQPGVDMREPGTVATARLPQLENVTFRQRLDAQLPLDTPFKDENGRDVTLGRYF